MISSFKSYAALTLRVSIFLAIFAGPICAMTLQSERGLGDDPNAIGFVLLKSIQRG